jgi:hypothetical protein
MTEVKKGAKGLKVYCPGCKKSFHETTEHFDPGKPARGHMVRLSDPYRKWGWCSFGDQENGLSPDVAERKGTYYSEMDCPGCGAQMAPHRFLYIKHEGGLIHTGKLRPNPVDPPEEEQAAAETMEAMAKEPELDTPEAVASDVEAEDSDENAPRHVRVLQLRGQGLSYANIAKAVGDMSAETARRICINHEKKQEAVA